MSPNDRAQLRGTIASRAELADGFAHGGNDPRSSQQREWIGGAGQLAMISDLHDPKADLRSHQRLLTARSLDHDDRRCLGLQHIAQRHLPARHDVGHVVQAQRPLAQLRDPLSLFHREQRTAGAEQQIRHACRLSMDIYRGLGEKPLVGVELNLLPGFVVLRLQRGPLLVGQAPEQHRLDGDAGRVPVTARQPVQRTLDRSRVAFLIRVMSRGGSAAAMLVLPAAAARARVISSDLGAHGRGGFFLLNEQSRGRCTPSMPRDARQSANFIKPLATLG